MLIGYARVSRNDQKLELQTDALTKAGITKIYSDKITGTKVDRPALNECLNFVREGDTLFVWRLDRLARSMKDLIELSFKLQEKNVQLVSLTENIDTSTTTGKLFFHIFGALAEFERNVIIERTYAGLAAARERGKLGGRKRALTEKQVEEIKENFQKLPDENKDFEKFAKIYKTSSRTIRRVINGEY